MCRRLFGAILLTCLTSCGHFGIKEITFGRFDVQFEEGDDIVIEHVLSTSSGIITGDRVVVTGRYHLASREKANIGLSVTSTVRGQRPSRSTSEVNSSLTVKKGSGTFILEYEIDRPGNLHVSFYGYPTGRSFGNVYFAAARR